MDSNKQEAIDVLLLSNACQGELSIQSQSLLDKSDLLGEYNVFTRAIECSILQVIYY